MGSKQPVAELLNLLDFSSTSGYLYIGIALAD